MTPFTYSKVPSAANQLFEFTSENSSPALLVWLFLVTQPSFIQALEEVTDPDGEFDVVFKGQTGPSLDIAGLAALVNLTPDAVRDILRKGFLKSAHKSAFVVASAQFESYVKSVRADYDPTECSRIQGLSYLATKGCACRPDCGLSWLVVASGENSNDKG